MDGAKRRLLFDEKVYFLTKDGAWYHLIAKDFKLANDDGELLRLLLNKGRSTQRGIRVSFTFSGDGTVLFDNNAGLRHEGEWENLANEIVAILEDDEKNEIHKFYFSWDQEDLLLKKLVIQMAHPAERVAPRGKFTTIPLAFAFVEFRPLRLTSELPFPSSLPFRNHHYDHLVTRAHRKARQMAFCRTTGRCHRFIRTLHFPDRVFFLGFLCRGIAKRSGQILRLRLV